MVLILKIFRICIENNQGAREQDILPIHYIQAFGEGYPQPRDPKEITSQEIQNQRA